MCQLPVWPLPSSCILNDLTPSSSANRKVWFSFLSFAATLFVCWLSPADGLTCRYLAASLLEQLRVISIAVMLKGYSGETTHAPSVSKYTWLLDPDVDLTLLYAHSVPFVSAVSNVTVVELAERIIGIRIVANATGETILFMAGGMARLSPQNMH